MKQVDDRTFDAYYKWLAIPPREQPPNHYRLLGVELFEDDLDVIAAAADRQMAHVKSFSSGKYASLTQQLLNELAAARICLLNPEQKARYDMQLKQPLSSGQQSEQLSFPPVTDDAIPSYPYRRLRRNRHKTPVSFVLIIVGAAMGLLAGYGALSLMSVKGFGTSEGPRGPGVPKEVKQEPARAAVHQRPQKIVLRDVPLPTRQVPTPIIPAVDREESRKRAVPERVPAENPRPNQTIRLNLEKETQREAITLKGNIKFVQLDGSGYTLNPATGKLPVEVTMEGPRPVTLKISIDKGMLVIEPTVKSDAGKSIPFTTKNLDALLRRVMRAGTNAANYLESLKLEQATIKANLDARVPMAYLAYKAANARVKELDVIIPEVEKSIVPLEAEARATKDLADFAHQLNGKCSIVIEASGEN